MAFELRMKVGNLPLPPHRGALQLINEERAGIPTPKAAGSKPREWENQWVFQSCRVGMWWGVFLWGPPDGA